MQNLRVKNNYFLGIPQSGNLKVEYFVEFEAKRENVLEFELGPQG
jgi:hypothetical protein